MSYSPHSCFFEPLRASRQWLAAALVVCTSLLTGFSCLAQTPASYPSKPVKLLIPFPAGGATDYAARAIGTALSEVWGQPVVFENRVGAGSTIGTEMGAKSPPDGYTLVMGIPAGMTIAPHIYPKLGYDPQTDFVAIGGFATSPLVMVVPVDSPFKTLGELVAYAKEHPGKLSYASNGNGSLPHLATEWLLSQAKINMVHVPYRGSALALPDLVSGRVQVMMDIIVSALPLVEGGRLRVLAVTGAQPTSRLPGIKTVASMGYPSYAADQWYGLFAPAGTPAAIVKKIETDMAQVTTNTRLRGQMWQRGAEIAFTPGATFAKTVKTDSQRWAGIVQSTGARAE